MYGLLVESIVEVIKKKYGKAVWEKVRQKVKLEVNTFSTHSQYNETIILKIVKALGEITGSLIFKYLIVSQILILIEKALIDLF